MACMQPMVYLIGKYFFIVVASKLIPWFRMGLQPFSFETIISYQNRLRQGIG